MKHFFLRILAWLCVPLLLLTAFQLHVHWFQNINFPQIKNFMSEWQSSLCWLCLAAFPALRYMLEKLFFSKSNSTPFLFIDTLEHELTHALFGFLSLTPPETLSASAFAEGQVTFKRQNILMVLAPYFFPLWAILWSLLGWIIHQDVKGIWNAIGFGLMGLYLYRLAGEIRWYQTDLREYGFVFSLGLIFCLLPLSLGFIFYSANIAGFSWLSQAFVEIWAILKDFYNLAHQLKG